MGVIFTPTASASAPTGVEAGIVDAWFVGVEQESHPEWAGPGKFGKNDTGERFNFGFLLAGEDGEPLYEDGEQVTVEKLTGTNLNPTSKTVPAAVKVLKGLLTQVEFAQFAAGKAPDSDDLIGRPCQLIISIKENGWPNVDDVLPARKGFKARKAA